MNEKKQKGGKRIGAGRKPLVIDWSIVDSLLLIACTGEEISSVLNVDYDTLNKHCKNDKLIELSEYIKNGINKNFRPSLRRIQRQMAMGKIGDNGEWIEKPNITMLIWLGKQYLGQSDKVENILQLDQRKKSVADLFPPEIIEKVKNES